MSKTLVLCCFCSLLSMTIARAAVIVNVNSDVNDIPNPVTVLLDAGPYIVTPIGPADGGRNDYDSADRGRAQPY